jgi:peptide chain release factor subunit 3
MIGHVDSGKSTLCGQILLKCGCVDEREFEKIKTQADADGMRKWAISRIVDINEEEQLRGKTHEFNRIDFKYLDNDYQLIDTPGHQTYVRSMIEGLSCGADVVVVVVSMHEKEWNAGLEGGMLREHIKIAFGMGINNVVLAANKMDLIDWSKSKCFERLRLMKNFCVEVGFAEDRIRVVPISASNGFGIVDLIGIPDWYRGSSLIDTIRLCQIYKHVDVMTKTSKILVEFKSEHNGIISAGFRGVAYSATFYEYEFEIVGVKSKILRQGENGLCWLKMQNEISCNCGTGIILRHVDGFVGVGIIRKNM